MTNIRTISVDNMILEHDKITKVAFDDHKNSPLYEGTKAIAMEKKGSSSPISTFVSLELKDEYTENLTFFDKLVLEAITTLYIDGKNQYITNSMIFHVLVGDNNRRMSKNFAEDINSSLIRLMSTIVTINASEEAQIYPKLKNFKYRSPIVPGVMVEAQLNGHTVSCIEVLKTPPLFMYADMKNQISRVSMNLIALPFSKAGKENKDQLLLLHYLLRRITSLGKISTKINYDTLYHDLHSEENSALQKFKLRERAKKILDAWKNQQFGDIFFIGYEEIKKSGIPCEIILQFEYIKLSSPDIK